MRAAIYARVSTDQQERDGTSLETQVQRCTAYVRQRGWLIGPVEQEAHSGFVLDGRKKLTRLRDAMRRNEFDVLVFFAVDRLSRNTDHQGFLFYEAEQAGVRFESVTEDLDGPAGRTMRFVAGLLAEFEREKIRERTMRGKAKVLEQGNVPTWTCDLYGYRTRRPTKDERKQGAGSHRIVIAEEAAIVREVYERVAEGWSRQQIADDLNARGVASPGSTKMDYRTPRKVFWRSSSIQQLIPNPAYKGWTVANRLTRQAVRNAQTGRINKQRQIERPMDEWTIVDETGRLSPAIVEPELWHRANERLAANRGARTRNLLRPMLLRGRLHCAICGGPMHPDSNENRPNRTNHYRCRYSRLDRTRVAMGDERCSGRTSIPQQDLDAWAWSEVLTILEQRANVVSEIRRRLEAPDTTGLETEIERIRGRLVGLDREANKAVELHLKEVITAAQFEEQQTRIRGERAEAEQALASVEARRGRNHRDLARLEGLDDLVRRVGPRLANADDETKAQVVSELGVTVRATRVFQELSWELPLPSSTESDTTITVDLSAVEEPGTWTRALVLAEEREEWYRSDPRRPTDRRSASPATSRRSRSIFTCTGSPTAGATCARKHRSRPWSSSNRSCRWNTGRRSTSCSFRSANTTAPAFARSVRPAPSSICAGRLA